MEESELRALVKEINDLRSSIMWLGFSDKDAQQEDHIWTRSLEIRGLSSEAKSATSHTCDYLIRDIDVVHKGIGSDLAERQPRWQVVHARQSIHINRNIVRLTWMLGIFAVLQLLLMVIQILIGK